MDSLGSIKKELVVGSDRGGKIKARDLWCLGKLIH